MTNQYFPLITVFALALTGSAAADPQSECSIDASSQVEIGDCLADAERIADATVASALGFAMQTAKELDEATGRESAVPALETAQAGWSGFRDQHCEFVGTTYGGGSGTGIAIRSCRVALARTRADELMRFTQ